MSNVFKKIGAALMAAAFAVIPATSAMAAPEDIINTARTGSITLHKYDITAAYADGLSLKEPNGEQDAQAESDFADYAIEGVEFTFAKVADIVTYSNEGSIEVMFNIPSQLANILNLSNPLSQDGMTLYSSAQINKGLKDLLADPNNTGGKNTLEDYVMTLDSKQTMMTDSDGYAYYSNLPLGLYMFVETKVPANVYSTTDPFFVSLPMTYEDGSAWFYDVYVYPKNQTDIPDLDKRVRQDDDEEMSRPDDAYNHSDYMDVATGSEGDVMDYIFVSRMPDITSQATYLTQYEFQDQMAKGLTYNKDTAIYFYENADDAYSNNTDAASVTWAAGSPNFSVSYGGSAGAASSMDVAVTEAGLAEINPELARMYMVVSYSATINSDITPTLGDEGNDNFVTLTWRRTNMDHPDQLEDKARVYTFGINLQKNFESGEGSNEAAQTTDATKVQFVLQNETDGHYVTATKGDASVAGVYYVTDGTQSEDEAGGTKFSPDESGKLIINGLEADTYILTEIQTTDGYSLLKEPITIVISSTSDEFLPSLTTHYDTKDVAANTEAGRDFVTEIEGVRASATVDTDPTNMSEFTEGVVSANARVDITVTNTPSFKLPMTGGTGALICTLTGCAAAFGGILIATKRGKKNEDKDQ